MNKILLVFFLALHVGVNVFMGDILNNFYVFSSTSRLAVFCYLFFAVFCAASSWSRIKMNFTVKWGMTNYDKWNLKSTKPCAATDGGWIGFMALYLQCAINVRHEPSTCTIIPASSSKPLPTFQRGNHYFLVVLILQLLFRFEQIASHTKTNEKEFRSLIHFHSIRLRAHRKVALILVAQNEQWFCIFIGRRLAHPAKVFIRNVSKNVNWLNTFNECQRQHS